jgi:arylsulfatase
VGNWKIVAAGKEAPWELYDLRTDRSETRNLAGKKPSKTRELSEIWNQETRKYDALALADSKAVAK